MNEITIVRPTGFDLMHWLNHNCDGNIRVVPSTVPNITAIVHGLTPAERWQVSVYKLPHSNIETFFFSKQQLLEFAMSYGYGE